MIRVHFPRPARPNVTPARGFVLVTALAALATLATEVGGMEVAFAQQVDTSAGAGAPGASAPSAGVTQDTQGSVPVAAPVVPAAPIYGGAVAPTPPGVPVGGGNATESSARPVVGDREDSFDLGPGAGGAGGQGTAFGSSNGPVFQPGTHTRTLGDAGVRASATAHAVRKGDTLWGICDTYFQNPYQWPRIWSYNPQIQNPHWIYPNDVVRLRPGGALDAAQGAPGAIGAPGPGGAPGNGAPGGARDAMMGRNLGPETIYLRDQGYIDDDSRTDWGSITGAPEDKMFLTDFDELYVRIGPDHEVRLGQELTVFRSVRDVPTGKVIAIQGTLRVDQWNAETRIARAQVTETLDTIERGARVGPVTRRFEVTPPARNDVDLRAHVLVAVRPHAFYGAGQVVFLDKGGDDGLRPGNRLFIVRRGDAWRATMASPQTADRVAIEREAVADLERVPRPADEKKFPEEVVGELRVLNVQKKSATCYLTRSHFEIEVGDEAVARKGY